MRPDIDTKKPIQMSYADRDGNAIGKWFDFVLIHMTNEHAYGHTADTNEQMSVQWKFTEWKFRNKPQQTKLVRGWLNIYTTNVGNLWPDRGMADTNAGNDRVACIYIEVPEGRGLGE